MEQSSKRVVEAEEFRLVDSHGRLRSTLRTSDASNGAPAVVLYDANRIPLLSLEVQNDLPRVTFHAPLGQPVIAIGVHDDGGTVLTLSRTNGTLGLFVRVPDDADADVRILDKDGQPMWGIS